jgi:hypothetical protein
MSGLKEYINELPLDRNSEAAKDLLSRIDRESSNSVIGLTAVYSSDGTPPYLTEEMNAWYTGTVQRYRGGALAEVLSVFAKQKTRTGGRGFLFEYRRDMIERDMLKKIHDEHDVLKDRPKVSRRYEQLKEYRHDYGTMKAKYRRDAVDWNPYTYWLLIFCAIITEYAINWESFTKIPYLQNTPAFVFGTVTLVALVFVFSSHLVGILIKQGRERFGGHVPKGEKRSTIILLIFALILFALSMGLIVWGRMLLVDDIIRENRILKGESSGADALWLYGGALLGNVIVWILGVAWSIWRHDSVPNFVELRAKMTRLEVWLDKQYKKYLQKRNQRHRLDARRELDHLNGEETTQSESLVGYHQAAKRPGGHWFISRL